MSYNVVDRNGEPINQTPFESERKAYEAKRVYEGNCYEPRPYKVVLSEETRALAEDTFARIERSSK